MIDEEQTFEMFGYYTSDLKPQSHKKIVAICDKCGIIRLIEYRQYVDLCISCVKVGKPGAMLGKHHSKKTKGKISKSNLGKKRSEETKQKMRDSSPHLSGEDNPCYGRHHTEESKEKMRIANSGKNNSNWNPNITDDERNKLKYESRNYPEYHKWRTAVYKGDNYQCRICGDNKGHNLNAHHLESYANNPNLRTTLENGITICETCHKDFHHQYGMGNNTKQQFIEFIGSN